MLNHIHEEAIGERIKSAYNAVLAEGRHRTRDLGGTASTTEFTEALVRRVAG
jgi:isocitrate dehydrogenase (NAD+)